MRNHSSENEFDLHENENACRTHFHMKGFALRLVLKQGPKRTRKWPIALLNNCILTSIGNAEIIFLKNWTFYL